MLLSLITKLDAMQCNSLVQSLLKQATVQVQVASRGRIRVEGCPGIFNDDVGASPWTVLAISVFGPLPDKMLKLAHDLVQNVVRGLFAQSRDRDAFPEEDTGVSQNVEH